MNKIQADAIIDKQKTDAKKEPDIETELTKLADDKKEAEVTKEAEIKKAEETGKKPRKPRAKKAVFKPKPEDLKPYFDTLNLGLKKLGGDPMDQDEIDSGMISWYPVYEKNHVIFMEKLMYIAPVVWSIAVLFPRAIQMLAKKKSEKPETVVSKKD